MSDHITIRYGHGIVLCACGAVGSSKEPLPFIITHLYCNHTPSNNN